LLEAVDRSACAHALGRGRRPVRPAARPRGGHRGHVRRQAGPGRDPAPSQKRDRWRRYDRFLTDTWRDSRFGDHHSTPLVIYVLAYTQLIPTFLNAADKHLTAWV
jgi:hypothetical protein